MVIEHFRGLRSSPARPVEDDRHAAGIQIFEQAGRFVERLTLVAHAQEFLVLGGAEKIAEFGLDVVAGECRDDLVSAHADMAVNAPDR